MPLRFILVFSCKDNMFSLVFFIHYNDSSYYQIGQYTSNSFDHVYIQQKRFTNNWKIKSLPRVEKVLKYYLGICMRLALGLTADCICRMFQSFAFDCTWLA